MIDLKISSEISLVNYSQFCNKTKETVGYQKMFEKKSIVSNCTRRIRILRRSFLYSSLSDLESLSQCKAGEIFLNNRFG